MIRPVAGPDPSPHRPRLRVPPGACDCHCHVFGPAAQFPYAGDRQYTPPDAPLEDYIALLDTLGIERTVIVQPSVYGTDNGCTEDGMRRLGERARGIAVVDDTVDDAELERLHAAGFRGVRFNLIHTGGSAPLELLEQLAARVAPLGWHVQIYLRGRLLPEIKSRLTSLLTPVVIDHLGHMEADQGTDQPGFTTLLELIETGRTWVKLCPYRFDWGGPPWQRAAPFAQALAKAAPERLVWGTDWPHPDIPGGVMPNDGDLVDALGSWFSDGGLISRVLVDNPATLYGFDR